MITANDIYISFDEKVVLDGLNLQVARGETLVVLGRSGCGKSVLLKILLGLIPPNKGEIWIDGENVTHFNERKFIPVRKKIGMLFQASALFDSLTVGENVAYALNEHTKLSSSEIKDKVAQAL